MSEPNFDFRLRAFFLGANPVFRTFRFVQRLRVGLSARRRRVSIRPKVERFANVFVLALVVSYCPPYAGFALRSRVLCPSQADANRLCYCPP